MSLTFRSWQAIQPDKQDILPLSPAVTISPIRLRITVKNPGRHATCQAEPACHLPGEADMPRSIDTTLPGEDVET
jgi:hypothetical protein